MIDRKEVLIPLIITLFILYFVLPIPTHSADWSKYPNNPIINYGLGNWDGSQVANPAILHIGDIYFNLYQGSQTRWNIGLTTSSDGITNWSVSQRILSPGTSNGWEVDVGDPVVIQNDDIYKMWFTSSTSFWTSGLDRFRLSYAESTNLTNWTKNDWILKGTPGAWDEGGIARGLSLLYIDNIYHLWYGGTNISDLITNPYWRIGYATSNDGIHWNKENLGNPVIESTMPWELNNVSYPTVIYSGGIYHMWYGAGLGDMPTQIVYAYSKDGIIWNKPHSYNPVLTLGPSSFDSKHIMPHTIMHEGDMLKMWYSGFSHDGHWRIGYATAPESSLPTPDPNTIPTSTLTPTPVPTATPIPTPTPLIAPTKKVVVIPGVTASWNPDALLNCKMDNYTGDWTLFHLARSVYTPVVDALFQAGWSATIYSYDWRMPVAENETALATYINGLATGWQEKVSIVGHSMGGLLGRAYITQEQESNKAEKFVSVGAPHLGAVAAYPTWEAGEIWEGDLGWKFLLTTLAKSCSLKTKLDDRVAVQTYFRSVSDLLPVFDYLTDKSSGQTIAYDQMHEKNTWLTNPVSFPFYNTSVATLRGTNRNTTVEYQVGPPAKRDAPGNWIDGKPVLKTTTSEGDGTVLLTSSEIPSADNTRVISTDHTGLISSKEGVGQILDMLGVAPQTTQSIVSTVQSPAPPTSGLFIIGYPADFWIVSPDESIVKDSQNLTVFPNPKSGAYKLIVFPKDTQTRVVVAQFLPNGKILWKEYTLKNRLPKIKTITFDANNPIDDAMQ